ncbi:MAG: glycosyltransferase [Verrucomicrobia bacterium]|nr:glycosyltransferase [Verrucomicrobiota bacterium]MBU6446813.1 glycosyltransferase [Verrucomicrobiota bacterium]
MHRSLSPLVSVVIPTKNSLPHLKNAIEGLRRQTYQHFELIIQDGGSTDGTLEYLANIHDLPSIDIQSQIDSGLGQAYNRGIARCRGDYLFLTASDERLFDHTLEKLLEWFKEYPSAAVIYGGALLVDSQGKEVSRFIPEPFDLIKFMKCELFPSTAGLLNRKVLGDTLFYDETLKTCPDYEFWLRIGHRFPPSAIIHQQELLMANLADRTSMTCRAEFYESFCRDKLLILNRFLSDKSDDLKKEHVRAQAGILHWAANALTVLEGVSSYMMKLCDEAEQLHLTIDTPPSSSRISSLTFSLYYCDTLKERIQKIKRWWYKKTFPVRIKGNRIPWATLVQATIQPTHTPNQKSYWVKIRMKVCSGVLAILFMDKQMVRQTKIFPFSSKTLTTYYPIHNPEDFSIIFRNGYLPGVVFELYELSMIETDLIRVP